MAAGHPNGVRRKDAPNNPYTENTAAELCTQAGLFIWLARRIWFEPQGSINSSGTNLNGQSPARRASAG